MITEDYVSFETAKLLKEKGFDGQCFYIWVSTDNRTPSLLATANFVEGEMTTSRETLDVVAQYHMNIYGMNNKIEGFLCPTLQMAMKWLREVHNLHIMVNCIGKVNYDPIVQRFDGKDFEIEGVEVGTTRRINGKWEDVRRGFKTYEQACETAIRYCLENLVNKKEGTK